MGTWGVSEKELIERLTNCLDDIEGDFNKKDLKNALEFMKTYGFTSDASDKYRQAWRGKLI